MTSPSNTQKPAASAAQHEGLPIGTRFGELEILRVIGVGGFGIVYLAFDHSLEREVALKEYMPASLAARGEGAQVTVRSGALAETYAIGLRSFVNEARLLARFDHPSLVKVYRFWEDNATAYMVMPYLQGRTVRDARRLLSQSPDEAWIRSVVDPMLSALEALHREGVFHRDIAPDNILLPPQGPPVLLDFGAARHVINDRTQTLTAIFKPSYAPIEQYGEMTSLRQGAWTDLYALGAVVHFLLRGAPPAPATARAIHDAVVPLANESFAGVSPQFLKAIDWALAVRPNERPQSADELRSAIEGRTPIPAPVQHDTNLDGSPAGKPAAAAPGASTRAASLPKPAAGGPAGGPAGASAAGSAASMPSKPPPAPPAPTPWAPLLPPVAPLAPPSAPLTQGAASRAGPPSTSMAWIDADEVTVPPRTGVAPASADKPFDPDDTVVLSEEARAKLLATMQSAVTLPNVAPIPRAAAAAGGAGHRTAAGHAAPAAPATPRRAGAPTTGGKTGVKQASGAPHSSAGDASQKPMPAWMLGVGGLVVAAVLGGGAYWKFSGPPAAPVTSPAATPADTPAAIVQPTPPPKPTAATPAVPAPAASGAAVVVDVAPPSVALTPAPEAAPPVVPALPPVPSAAEKRQAAKAEAARVEAAKAEAAKAETAKLAAAAKAKAAKVASRPVDTTAPNLYTRPKDDPLGLRPKPPTGASAVAVAPVKPAEAPPAPVPSGPATAREACGDRVFISLALCMQRECERPRFRDNAECVKLAEDIRRRREQ